MTVELARLLLASGAISRPQIQAALFAAVRHGVPFMRALAQESGLDEEHLEREVAKGDSPLIRNVVPLTEVIARLPIGLCTRLLAIPVRVDPLTATVDIATANPLDPHTQAEFAFHLQAPIRLIRAPLSVIEDSLREFEGHIEISSEHRERNTHPYIAHQQRSTPAFGSPSVQPEPMADGRVSDVPIPLVRRSVAPRRIDTQNSLDPGEKPGSLSTQPLAQSTSRRPRKSSNADPLGTTSEIALIDPEGVAAVAIAAGGPTQEESLPPTAWLTSDFYRARIPPNPPMRSDPSAMLVALRTARSRNDVVEQIVEAMQTVATRTGVMVARRNAFVGWMCTPELADPLTFRQLRIAADQPSVLATASSKGWFLGHVPPVAPHQPLLDALGTPNLEVSLVAVKVADRTVMLILSTDLRDTLNATRLADLLAREAGEALARILSSEKRTR